MDEANNQLCLRSAKSAFLELISRVDPAVAMDFVEWVGEQCNDMPTISSDDEQEHDNDDIMDRIIEDLRKKVPFTGVLSSEKIIFPESEQSCLNPSTTINVDAFLYNDEEIDKLCDEGRLSRYYCTSCWSYDVKPLDFISHSMSQDQLRYIFKDILPSLLPDIQDTQLVDIGSRLGAVLYGAALYSSVKNIFGVEMNKEFCKIQQEILQKYNLDKRVQIKCCDICEEGLLLKNADIVILNNVFEFFQTQEMQASSSIFHPLSQVLRQFDGNILSSLRIWQFLRSSITKKGCIIVSVPSLEEATKLSNEPIMDLENWVNRLHVEGNDSYAESTSQRCEMGKAGIFFYRVCNRFVNQ